MIQLLKARSGQKQESKSLIKWGLSSPLRSLVTYVKFAAAKMTLANQIAKERNALSRLSDHQLRDVGLVRDQLDSELGRGVFDIPSQRFYEIGFQQGGLGSSKQPRISRIAED